jgi:hypothetical protein
LAWILDVARRAWLVIHRKHRGRAPRFAPAADPINLMQ